MRTGLKVVGIIAVAIVIILGCIELYAASLPGTRRVDLQRHDLSAPGREMIQARVEIAPGITAPRHHHPGEEIVYALEGVMEYRLDGRAPVILRAGDVLFIPAGVPHSVTNIGTGNAAELATYIVEKGKPLLVVD